MPTRDEIAADIARDQHGLITRSQAFAAGISADTIRSRRRSGAWVSIESGVYLINGAPITWHVRVLSICLAFDGVASHRSGARLTGVDGYTSDVIEISIPAGRKVRRPGVIFHESTDLHLFEPVMIDGIPTTPPERLAVDLGAVVPFGQFERAIDDMVRRRWVTWQDLFDQLVLHSRRGRNGVGVLRSLLELRFGDDVGESTLEAMFFRACRRRRLPEPVPQLKIFDHVGRFIARVDYAYPERHIAIEVDSRKHHGDPIFEADRDKRIRLAAEGWTVIEITRRMLLHDGFSTFNRLERIIRHAGS